MNLNRIAEAACRLNRITARRFKDAMKRRWLHAGCEAESLVEKLPADEAGCLYLDATGKPVCPDPASPDSAKLTRHYGSVKGTWPHIVES